MPEPRGTRLASSRGMRSHLYDQIKILPVDALYPFEWSWECPASAADEEPQSHVRHPLLATTLSDGSYLVLDSADEFCRLARSGLPCLPVQVFPAERVQILSSRLGLTGVDPDALRRFAARHDSEMTLSADNFEPSADHLTLQFTFPREGTLYGHVRWESPAGCPPVLDQMARSLLSAESYVPLVDRTYAGDNVFRGAATTGVMSIPAFSLEQLRSAAATGRPFPPRFARVAANVRVLDIDFPAKVLWSDVPLDEKDRFLRELILFREQSCRTTRIHGHVYILNR